MMSPKPASGPDRGVFHILVVEDDFLVRYLIVEELRLKGIIVIEAAGADEAWTYLESGSRVDLVFSDIQMPGAINGIDLAHRMTRDYPTIPVVLTSGNVAPGALRGISAFMPKPYAANEAAAALLAMLERENGPTG